jgi:hypothetical protein
MSALAFLVAGKTECAFIVRREVQFLQKKPQLLLGNGGCQYAREKG